MKDVLRDISDIDAVGWWPLAPGWWLSAILLAVLIYGLKSFWPMLVRWYRRPRDRWRRDARLQLRALRRRLDKADQKILAGELSELIRRIAVARCGREVCAGLSGQVWIEWLTENDPEAFDWREYGGLLQQLAYAPPGETGHYAQLEAMIDATFSWTEASACSGEGNA